MMTTRVFVSVLVVLLALDGREQDARYGCRGPARRSGPLGACGQRQRHHPVHHLVVTGERRRWLLGSTLPLAGGG